MNQSRRFFCLILIVSIIFFLIPVKSVSQTATVPINITVNGTLTITDAANDASSGKNPTINVKLAVTPDLGAAEVTGDANFRIRTNVPKWKLTAQRTSEVDKGPTNILAKDVGLSITTQVGSKANPKAGTLVAPFNGITNIGTILTTTPVTVISGAAKTSLDRDSTNTNNYFQVNTRYSIFPDFFYGPGTWETTVTYTLVAL